MRNLKITYALWAIILIILIAGLIMLSTVNQKKNKAYKEAEKRITEASKRYIEINGWYPDKGDNTKITFKDLIDKDLIDEVIIAEKNDKCDGYVLVTNSGVIEYKTFMKCKNYSTVGYNRD